MQVCSLQVSELMARRCGLTAGMENYRNCWGKMLEKEPWVLLTRLQLGAGGCPQGCGGARVGSPPMAGTQQRAECPLGAYVQAGRMGRTPFFVLSAPWKAPPKSLTGG